MPKPKKALNHISLWTELSVAVSYINDHNFGLAKQILIGILKRLDEEVQKK